MPRSFSDCTRQLALAAGLLTLACCMVGPAEFCMADTDQNSPLKVTFLIGEDEYKTWETLPAFVERELKPLGIQSTIIHADPQNLNHFPDIEKIADADVLFVSVRRRPLPKKELDAIRSYLKAGKSLVGIRTTSHAFATRANLPKPPGLDQWPEFDVEVLGGKYENHYANEIGSDISTASHAQGHAILKGIRQGSWHSTGSLYKRTANKGTTILLNGIASDKGKPVTHPVAWTHQLRRPASRRWCAGRQGAGTGGDG